MLLHKLRGEMQYKLKRVYLDWMIIISIKYISEPSNPSLHQHLVIMIPQLLHIFHIYIYLLI